jgi:predicted 3-demethylubiquinone-9 3-methyltransferase (glyoxalase superfamily)
MKDIQICLWFDNEAEDAAKFYCQVFKNSKMGKTVPYNVETPSNKPIGSVMFVEFEINGTKFMGLNGGTFFKQSEAVSFVINCETDEEFEHYWKELSAVPESEQCGWCKDKFGVSWQVIPPGFNELMDQKDPKKAKAAMQCMMEQHKLNVAEIQKAVDAA